MELILWRHAQAVDADGTIDDLKRSLTQEGEHQAAEMAAWLARHMPTDARWSAAEGLLMSQCSAPAPAAPDSPETMG